MSSFQNILNQIVEQEKQNLKEKSLLNPTSNISSPIEGNEENLPSQNFHYIPTVYLGKKRM